MRSKISACLSLVFVLLLGGGWTLQKNVRYAVVSPDGRYVAYSWGHNGVPDVLSISPADRERPVFRAQIRPAVGVGENNLKFSPDSRKLSFFATRADHTNGGSLLRYLLSVVHIDTGRYKEIVLDAESGLKNFGFLTNTLVLVVYNQTEAGGCGVNCLALIDTQTGSTSLLGNAFKLGAQASLDGSNEFTYDRKNEVLFFRNSDDALAVVNLKTLKAKVIFDERSGYTSESKIVNYQILPQSKQLLIGVLSESSLSGFGGRIGMIDYEGKFLSEISSEVQFDPYGDDWSGSTPRSFQFDIKSNRVFFLKAKSYGSQVLTSYSLSTGVAQPLYTLEQAWVYQLTWFADLNRGFLITSDGSRLIDAAGATIYNYRGGSTTALLVPGGATMIGSGGQHGLDVFDLRTGQRSFIWANVWRHISPDHSAVLYVENEVYGDPAKVHFRNLLTGQDVVLKTLKKGTYPDFATNPQATTLVIREERADNDPVKGNFEVIQRH